MAQEALTQLKGITEALKVVGKVTLALDVYNALVDGKLTGGETAKLMADLLIGEAAVLIPVAGPVIVIAYTALDASGQVDEFIDFIFPDKLEDAELEEIWDKMISLNITNGLTFEETFGRSI